MEIPGTRLRKERGCVRGTPVRPGEGIHRSALIHFSLEKISLVRAKPGALCAVRFLGMSPLPDGRADASVMASAYTSPGFATAGGSGFVYAGPLCGFSAAHLVWACRRRAISSHFCVLGETVPLASGRRSGEDSCGGF